MSDVAGSIARGDEGDAKLERAAFWLSERYTLPEILQALANETGRYITLSEHDESGVWQDAETFDPEAPA